VLPPSPQEIFEKRVTLVRHGYPEWLGYSILSVYRYWESALERDSNDPDEQFLILVALTSTVEPSSR
jgi:hypothetical protein